MADDGGSSGGDGGGGAAATASPSLVTLPDLCAANIASHLPRRDLLRLVASFREAPAAYRPYITELQLWDPPGAGGLGRRAAGGGAVGAAGQAAGPGGV